MMTWSTWSSRSIVACLLLSACPADPAPQPGDDSSTGQGSTSMGPGTTPMPTTTPADSSSTGTPGTTSTSTGPDDTTSSSSTGPADSTGGSSSGGSSSEGSSSGGSSSGGSSSGDPSTSGSSSGGSTTAGDPCDAGDGPEFTVTAAGAADYVINGLNDPVLTVVRGCSYTFNINAGGHPLFIKTVQGTGVGNAYNDGVIGNGTQNGVITWDVAMAAPDALFYNCQFHAPMTNTITVIDPL